MPINEKRFRRSAQVISVRIVGLKFTTTGDTLCSTGDYIILESIDFPEPVIGVAIEPKSKADEKKLSETLEKLQ